MKMQLLVIAMLAMFGAASAHAGTYTCDVELNDGSKTKIRGVVADSESQARRIAKENNSAIKWINCYKVD
ncbi:MAG: hypothetical protein H7232_02565 [Aeromicrobium sp.]|nr:hypothetical protein [Burkholderiales bacterium]